MNFSSAFLALAFTALLPAALAQPTPAVPVRTITVTGEAEIAVAPDLVVLQAGVQHEAKTLAEASEKASEAVEKALKVLKRQGVAEADVKTSYLNITPVWNTASSYGSSASPRAEIRGYSVSTSLTVRLRDTQKLERLLRDLLEAGLNSVHGLSFESSRAAELREQARDEALRKARDRAARMAGVLGEKLGPVQQLSDTGGSDAPVFRNRAEMAYSAKSSAVPVAAGELVLSASVSVTFALERPAP